MSIVERVFAQQFELIRSFDPDHPMAQSWIVYLAISSRRLKAELDAPRSEILSSHMRSAHSEQWRWAQGSPEPASGQAHSDTDDTDDSNNLAALELARLPVSDHSNNLATASGQVPSVSDSNDTKYLAAASGQVSSDTNDSR